MNVFRLIAFLGALSIGCTSVRAQPADTLTKARAEGSFTLGVRESTVPMSYMLGSKFMGYQVEICEDFVRREVPSAQLKYVTVTSANRIPLLQNGTVDLVCEAATNNLARQQQVAFAYTTYVTEGRYAVKKSSGITSVEQLKGKTIGTVTGSTTAQRLRKLQSDYNFEVVYARDHAEGFLLLDSDRIAAYVMDDNTLAGLISVAKNPGEYAIVGKPLAAEPLAIMMRKDDAPIKAAFDKFLKQSMLSGDLERRYNKWFTAPIPPRNTALNIPLSPSLRAAINDPNDRPAEQYESK